MSVLHSVVRGASRPLIHRSVLNHLDFVTGLENLPTSGPVVVVANHASYLDHFVTLTVLDSVRQDRVWYPTKAESFEGRASKLWHDAWHCYPVDREAPSQEIFAQAKRILDGGEVLGLYPEGTRGPGDELLPFKTGPFRMALASGAPIVPIGLHNLAAVLPKGGRRLTEEKGAIAIGPALQVPEGLGERETVQHLRDLAREEVSRLITLAGNPEVEQRQRSGDTVEQLVETAIASGLTDAGTLPEAKVASAVLLTELGLRAAPGHPGLRVQATRLGGLHALNGSSVLRPVRVARVNRAANRLADEHPDSPLAAYVAARTSAALPDALGGSTERARHLYARAASLDEAYVSKARLGAAEAHLKDGDTDATLEALDLAAASVDPDDPRAALRLARIDRMRLLTTTR